MKTLRENDLRHKIDKEIDREKKTHIIVGVAIAVCVVLFLAWLWWANRSVPQAEGLANQPRVDVVELDDYEKALARKDPKVGTLFDSAVKGNDESQFMIGNMYMKGVGLERNYRRAEKWLLAAAKDGNVDAQNNLGYLYKTLNDIDNAKLWYRKASQGGNHTAQLNLAILLKENSGTEDNDEEIIRLLKDSIVEDPDMKAHFYLGWVYLNDKNTANDEEGLALMAQAAEFGYPQAAYVMGQLYEDGQYVEKNKAESLEWYRKAFKNGYSMAAEKLKNDGDD